jgi:hypothetical protein
MSDYTLQELEFHIKYLLEKTQQGACVPDYVSKYGFSFSFKMGAYNDSPYVMVKSPCGRNEAMVKKTDSLAALAATYPAIDELVRCYVSEPKTDKEILMVEIAECRQLVKALNEQLDRMLFAAKGASK